MPHFYFLCIQMKLVYIEVNLRLVNSPYGVSNLFYPYIRLVVYQLALLVYVLKLVVSDPSITIVSVAVSIVASTKAVSATLWICWQANLPNKGVKGAFRNFSNFET